MHRDVKPANVLIAESRPETRTHVYLSDFGLTRRASSDSGLTGTGQFMGTLDYAAPEQFEGKPTDARTDVYSLGACWSRCSPGTRRTRAEFDAALMFAHISEPPAEASREPRGAPGGHRRRGRHGDGEVARRPVRVGRRAGRTRRLRRSGSRPPSTPCRAGRRSPVRSGARRSHPTPPGRHSSRGRLVVAGVAVAVVVVLLALLLPCGARREGRRGGGGDAGRHGDRLRGDRRTTGVHPPFAGARPGRGRLRGGELLGVQPGSAAVRRDLADDRQDHTGGSTRRSTTSPTTRSRTGSCT